jgi:hypothetical protein
MTLVLLGFLESHATRGFVVSDAHADQGDLRGSMDGER